MWWVLSVVRKYFILHNNGYHLGRVWLLRLERTKTEVYLGSNEWTQLGTLLHSQELFGLHLILLKCSLRD